MKRWGRNRIIRELKKRHISPYCVQKGLSEIDETEYLTVLEDVLQKKLAGIREPDAFRRRNKVARYALGRGFEASLVWNRLRILVPDD